MEENWVRWLVLVVFAAHGLAMTGTAVYLPWSIRGTKGDFVRASWLLGSGRFATAVGVVVWLLAGAGFIGAAFGLWQNADWWRPAAWIGSSLTLLAIGLWAGRVPSGAYVGGALSAGIIAYLSLS